MKEYSKLFKEDGSLTNEGLFYLKAFKSELDTILSSMAFDNKSQVRHIGAVLANIVGSKIADKQISGLEAGFRYKLSDINKLSLMSDEDFYTYLETKYGSEWLLKSLTQEDYERYLDTDR